MFGWHPQSSRFGLYSHLSGGRMDTSFSTALRTSLRGKMITGISFPSPFDRILEVDISEKLTDTHPSHRLVLEVAGSRSNLVLVSCADETILGCAYQVSSTTSVRPLQLSGPYCPPPSTPGKLNPLDLSLSSFSNRLSSLSHLPLEKAMCSAVKGMSPNIASLIVEKSGGLSTPLQSDGMETLFSWTSRWAGCS